MQNQNSFIIDCESPDGKWMAVFEDNAKTGYLYLCLWDDDSKEIKGIVDSLWIYDVIYPTIQEFEDVFITWSDDSNRLALIVDDECWGIMDLEVKRKLTAPRIDNCIAEIDFEFWENGLKDSDGEVLEVEKVSIKF